MNERKLEFKVGVVVLAAVFITVILIVMLGAAPNILKSRYTVFMEFPQAPGVVPNTPIRMSGIEIGRVEHVKLNGRGVLLTMKIDEQYTLGKNQTCRIGTGSLVTGDAIVEFIPNNPPGAAIVDGDYLTGGQVQPDPFEVLLAMAEDVGPAIVAIQTAGTEVAKLSHNLNLAVDDNEGQVQKLLVKTEETLDQFQDTMSTLNELVGDPELSDKLKRSLDGIPAMIEESERTMAEARKMLAGFERVTDSAEQNLANLEGFTRPLGQKGESLVRHLDESLDGLDDLIHELVVFTDSLNNSEGTIGRLVHDDELYERLNLAAGNIEDASQRLRPIMDDVRIITDKVARDPGGTVGVRSILNRNPSGLKTGLMPR